MLLYLGLYLFVHLGTTTFRAIQRANKYHYYYLSKGVMPFPRCFAKRLLDTNTFLYSIILCLIITALVFATQFIDQLTQV